MFKKGNEGESERDTGNRTVSITTFGKDEKQKKSMPNMISTTKYTWYTWLPKSLWEQFRRVANVYFLVISILMLIGTYATELYVSPLNPYSTVGTFAFVLLITCIKEGIEDLQRAKSDTFENTREVTIVTFNHDGTHTETVKKSQEIAPGDIIKLNGHCAVPADMILLLTSMHNDGTKCFIETANIDGETNLKVREAPPLLLESFAHIIENGQLTSELVSGSIEFEAPNKNIHKFTGNLKLDKAKEVIPLSADNILLRSAIFSNTDWGYGVVVYAGGETKIQMNNRHAPSKMSRLESNLNRAILIIIGAQIVLVFFSVISIYIMGFQDHDKLPYVYPPGNSDNESILPLWLEQIFVFFLLYNNFVPISLYVTIELVNLGQAFLMHSDENMYREELDVACQVRSSNLAQEIGQVSNIFSDKTGTLTRNEMKLVKFSLNGQLYDIPGANGEDTSLNGKGPASSGKSASKDAILQSFGRNKQTFQEFCRCLVTCHTVVREKTGNYRAESPDELALVQAVDVYNCRLLERGSKEMVVELFGERLTYEVLAVNPFNADRKRMSVLIRDPATNKYFVMCKGADNIMLPLCRITNEQKTELNQALDDLATLGLRTLIIASKPLDEDYALRWLKEYKAATISGSNREENIARVGAELEKEMNCIGVTAIEDRLQDEVPEVIADLARAGIVLWMLTGDKLETAINIGRSCNLILHETKLVEITRAHNATDFVNKLNKAYDTLVQASDNNYALVLDGPSFTYFDDKDLNQRARLLRVGQGCRSVISCRLTPTQKRELVRLVKLDTKPKATTLSIGDGANDVSMILEADVGVGIFGKEGRQAANNADFAIGEFKFLRRLLLVHGRWNYVRQSKTFLYSMHKNMVITFTLFWYSYFTAVSGTSLYESWVYSSFNIVLGLPIIFFGFLDRDITADFALRHPETYATGKEDRLLSEKAIGIWIFNAILYAVVLCLTFYYITGPTFKDYGIYEAGTVVFVGMVLSLQAKVAFYHHQWAYPQIIAMVISIIGMFIGYIILTFGVSDYYYDAIQAYGKGIFWYYACFSGPLFTIFIDWIGYYTQLIFWPTQEMLYHELDQEELKLKQVGRIQH